MTERDPGTLDAAWEALRDDLLVADPLWSSYPDEVLRRHRPLIEAALRASDTPGLDDEVAELREALRVCEEGHFA